MKQIVSNKEFIEQHATPGCVGLIGADSPIDNSIKKMQKFITSDGKHSPWSHAFIFSEKRQDGHWWVIESDLEFHRKQMKLGVQENRAEKYFDEVHFPNIAILDFGLSKKQQHSVIGEGLNLVSAKTQYSIREVFGVLYAFLNKKDRSQENKLAQENSLFCSAFVQHCYQVIDLQFAPNISTKHLAPQDIANTKIPHKLYTIKRK